MTEQPVENDQAPEGPAEPEPAAPASAGPDWGERIRAARAAQLHSVSVYEQTIRDAHTVGKRSVSQMAADIGIRDRTTLSRIVRQQPGEPVAVPTLPTVVYLRGPGHGPSTWAQMEGAMHARGWVTVRNDQAAWHLSRGGATVVHVNFSARMDDDPVTVQLMRAVCAQPAEEPSYPVADLLPTSASIALQRHHPEAAEFRVQVQTTEAQWKRLAGGRHHRPTFYDPDATNNAGRQGAFCLDAQQIARWVADLLE